jgi:hypothetical protein
VHKENGRMGGVDERYCFFVRKAEPILCIKLGKVHLEEIVLSKVFFICPK